MPSSSGYPPVFSWNLSLHVVCLFVMYRSRIVPPVVHASPKEGTTETAANAAFRASRERVFLPLRMVHGSFSWICRVLKKAYQTLFCVVAQDFMETARMLILILRSMQWHMCAPVVLSFLRKVWTWELVACCPCTAQLDRDCWDRTRTTHTPCIYVRALRFTINHVTSSFTGACITSRTRSKG
jgi:hypothetical protein